ncbi:MAG TPA: hypothetical protein VFO60_04870 [Candidatus Dormibacteraeota bacterium]|nr:hypothetical protein [Candidatus Dormibacteraeota bacterium]
MAAETMRGALDAALRGLGVISDVTIMSPWTPHRAAVDAAWSATPGKSIGLLDLGALADRWEVLGSTRRSEVRRGRREGTRVERFDIAAARRFSTVYEEAMEARAADARWRRGSGDFERLAGLAGSRFRLCVCEGSGGGAAALFLTAGARAAYHLAVRWGNLPGAASTVLWVGAEALAAEGCEELLLGGGVTDADDDPLLRFKQAFASRCEPLRVAARAFDRRAHEASAAAGHVRPLPGAAVDA